jgi:hypothetical protein
MRRPRQRSSFGPRLATIHARRVCTLVPHGRNPPADQREVRAANRTNGRSATDLAVGYEIWVSGIPPAGGRLTTRRRRTVSRIPLSGIPWCLKENGRSAADLPVAANNGCLQFRSPAAGVNGCLQSWSAVLVSAVLFRRRKMGVWNSFACESLRGAGYS